MDLLNGPALPLIAIAYILIRTWCHLGDLATATKAAAQKRRGTRP